MKYNFLGATGLKVSELGFGAGTLGGKGPLFSAWGYSTQAEANQMVETCLNAGINFFDTADAYSEGESERMLGQALATHRHKVVISTKVGIRISDQINSVGYSRDYLIKAVEGSLKRLNTDYIDVLQLHQFDSFTDLTQLMKTLDELVRSGKVRYIGASNFSGWQLMKAQMIAQQHGYERFNAHQVFYSLIGRDYEWELMPLADDQNIGAVVWSPLGWGRLTGKFDRQQPIPAESRLHQTAQFAPPIQEQNLYVLLDALKEIAQRLGRSVPQVALNWLLQRPTVSTVLIGARNIQQLTDNLRADQFCLTETDMTHLNQLSAVYPPYPYYPYWNGQFSERYKALVNSQFIT